MVIYLHSDSLLLLISILKSDISPTMSRLNGYYLQFLEIGKVLINLTNSGRQPQVDMVTPPPPPPPPQGMTPPPPLPHSKGMTHAYQ